MRPLDCCKREKKPTRFLDGYIIMYEAGELKLLQAGTM